MESLFLVVCLLSTDCIKCPYLNQYCIPILEQNNTQASHHTFEIHNSDVNGNYIHVGLITAVLCKSEDLITLQGCRKAETMNSDINTLSRVQETQRNNTEKKN